MALGTPAGLWVTGGYGIRQVASIGAEINRIFMYLILSTNAATFE